MAENTFLGLQPYTEGDAYRFKGRTEESQELLRLIVHNDYTVCYAESGEGKTSLLNAGVFPLLRENMYFPIAITFTSDDYQVTPDNFSTIIDRCIKDSITEYNEKNKGISVEYRLCSTDFQDLDCQAELLQELSKYSWWKLRNYKPQAMGLTFTPVFVFDQFEEVFNMPGSIVWTKKFFDWLEDVSSDSCPDEIVNKVREIIGTNAAFPAIKEEKDFKAVFSLRKEFIGELDYWGMQKCFIPSLKDNRYCLKALTYEGAKNVMTQQQRFEKTKVEQVLHYFVQQYSREPEKTIAENLPVIPALLLSVVCDSWEKDIDYFTGKDESEIGQSLNKILERFYDEAIRSVVNKLCSEGNNGVLADTIRNDIDTALFDLVDVNGKRVRTKATTTLGTIRLAQAENHRGEELRIVKYKKVLSDHRIIKISKIDGEDYVEVVHDALCPIIAKRKELYLAAEAKKREDEKLRDQAKKNRKRMILMSGIILIAIIIIGLFYYQNRKIEQSQWRMMENQARFVSEKAAKLLEAGDLYTARRLACEVLPKDLMNPKRPHTVEAEAVLRKAWNTFDFILEGHSDVVEAASFSSDGRNIISVSRDSTIRLWDTNTGLCKKIIKYHNLDGIGQMSRISPAGLVAIYSDSTILICDVNSRRSHIIREKKVIHSVIFTPDGNNIIYTTMSNIKMWNKSKNKTYRIYDNHQRCGRIAFNNDGKYLAFVSNDTTLKIFDVHLNDVIREFKGHKKVIYSICFTPYGGLVSASADSTLKIWDIKNRREYKSIKCENLITNVRWVDHAQWPLITSTRDNQILFWNLSNWGVTRIIKVKNRIILMDVNPEENKLVVASSQRDINIWSIKSGKERKVIKKNEYNMNYAAFSPDGRYVVSASDDNSVRIWDVQTGECVDSMLEHELDVNYASFSPDGHYIVSASDDHTIRLWDYKKREVSIIGKHDDDVYCASFSSDGKRVVSSSRDSTIRIWDVYNKKELIKKKEQRRDIFHVEFSPDGKSIAYGLNNTIVIRNAKTGDKILSPLKGHYDRIRSLAYSRDGKYIVSSSQYGIIIVQNVQNGKYTRIKGQEWNKYGIGIQSVSFSPNGLYVVSTSEDDVKIWDKKSGMLISQLEGHLSYVNSANFNRIGNSIVSTSLDGTIRIWDFPSLQELIDQTRERFKPLTLEERLKYYLE